MAPRMRHPGAIAAARVGTVDGDAPRVEPQGDGTQSPRVDPVDDRDRRAAAKPGRDLRDDRIEGIAVERQRGAAGDDRNAPAVRAVAAQFAGAIEPGRGRRRRRPRRQRFASILGEKGAGDFAAAPCPDEAR